MERRKFLLASGALAAGGAAGLGTGAFTSVEAERSVSVKVADDSNALLALDKTSSDLTNSAYADATGDAISIDLTGGNDNLSEDPEGINPNASTEIQNIFEVQNQGTQAVFVYVDPSAGVTPDSVTAPLPGQSRSGGYPKDGDLYIDPQASDLPNRLSFTDAPSLSLTGIYGLDGFPDGGGPYTLRDFTIEPGQSFNFGLQIGDAGSDFDGDISITLTADEELANPP